MTEALVSDGFAFRDTRKPVVGAEMGRVVMNAERGFVAGESPGAKLAQAERLSVPVIDTGGLGALLAGEPG